MKLKEFNVPGFYYEARLVYENDLAQIVIVERGKRNEEKKFVFLLARKFNNLFILNIARLLNRSYNISRIIIMI